MTRIPKKAIKEWGVAVIDGVWLACGLVVFINIALVFGVIFLWGIVWAKGVIFPLVDWVINLLPWPH